MIFRIRSVSDHHKDRFANGFIAAVFVAVSCLLLVRLGHYALWDDETMVALVAKGVMRTGDTVAKIDQNNIVAYRSGLLLHHGADRSTPPLSTYLTAASFMLFGVNTWAARLPFAFFGLATSVLLLRWAKKERLPTLALFIMGLLGTTSFFLYFRQCRYFAPAIFFSVALVYVYWRKQPTQPTLLIFAGLSMLLFASNCMNYAVLYACFGIDYVIWQRKSWRLSGRQLLLLLGPQIIFNGTVALVWNPFYTRNAETGLGNTFHDRMILFLWNWRDLDRCECLSIPLIIAALFLAIYLRRIWLLRACVALILYIAAISLVSPQPVAITQIADTRYLAPLIPLAIVIEAGVIAVVFGRWMYPAVVVAGIVFCTNLLNIPSLLAVGPRSTICSFVGELIHPIQDPYRQTALWINRNVSDGSSIWVLPGHAAYPLMFLAPTVRYAWQINESLPNDLGNLDPINYFGRQAPDYIIAFGPGLQPATETVAAMARRNIQYRPYAKIDVFYQDFYRPELLTHAFKAIPTTRSDNDAIYVFRRSLSSTLFPGGTAPSVLR